MMRRSLPLITLRHSCCTFCLTLTLLWSPCFPASHWAAGGQSTTFLIEADHLAANKEYFTFNNNNNNNNRSASRPAANAAELQLALVGKQRKQPSAPASVVPEQQISARRALFFFFFFFLDCLPRLIPFYQSPFADGRGESICASFGCSEEFVSDGSILNYQMSPRSCRGSRGGWIRCLPCTAIISLFLQGSQHWLIDNSLSMYPAPGAFVETLVFFSFLFFFFQLWEFTDLSKPVMWKCWLLKGQFTQKHFTTFHPYAKHSMLCRCP